jgi:hypothetical protein
LRALIDLPCTGAVVDFFATVKSELGNSPEALLGVLVDVHPLWQQTWRSCSRGLKREERQR